jgi:hypothetical protein
MDPELEPFHTALLPHLTQRELTELMAALQERIATLTVVVEATRRNDPAHARAQDARTVCQSVLVAVNEAILSIDAAAPAPQVVSGDDFPPLLMGEAHLDEGG